MCAQRRQAPTGRTVTDRAGRSIGRIRGDEYVKTISNPAQVLRTPRGYGFDAWAMETQVLCSVNWIVVENRCDGRVDRCTVAEFRRLAMTIDRGAGRQYVLPLDYWEQRSASGTTASDTGAALSASMGDPRQGRLL